MIDIHSHILPGVDDGAQTIEDSVAMLKMAAADGITDIVATPHCNHQYKFEPETIEQKISELVAAMDGSIRIHRGCDFHLSFDNIQDAFVNPARYTINHKRYLLVEFSDLLVPRTTDEVFFRMLSQGTIPVITHPERNPLLQKRIEKLKGWVDAGCLVQVTAQSVLGRFGKSAKAASDALLQQNLVHFIATDAHDIKFRPPQMHEAYALVARTHGARRAQLLFERNPGAALTGADTVNTDEPVASSGPEKKWYRFW